MLNGAPLSVVSRQNETGLSGFANSEVEYDVKGLYDHFTAFAGVDKSSSGTNAVNFTVTSRRTVNSGKAAPSKAAPTSPK